jgi:hypothetical protein
MMKHIHRGWVAAAALAVLLAGACGSATGSRAVRSTSARTVSCPVAFPRAPATFEPSMPAAGGLIPPRPMIAVICQYQYATGKARVVRRIALPQAAADGLAAVIDSAAPVPGRTRRCFTAAAALPFAQVIRFRYAAGATVSAMVQYATCPVALVTAGGHTAGLAGPVKDDLFYDTSLDPRGGGRRTPAVTGLGQAAARAAARRSGFSVRVDGEAIDTRVPFGTVIFQTDPPGFPESSGQIGVVLAVRPAAACAPPQLVPGFTPGGASTGYDMASIVIRDRSAVPCQLAGPLRLSGLNTAGQQVTSTITYQVAGTAVLSPHAAPAELAAIILLAAEYRDDPASPDGLCTAHQVMPASWRIVLGTGASISVPNKGEGPGRGLTTCRGQLATAGAVSVGTPGSWPPASNSRGGQRPQRSRQPRASRPARWSRPPGGSGPDSAEQTAYAEQTGNDRVLRPPSRPLFPSYLCAGVQ